MFRPILMIVMAFGLFAAPPVAAQTPERVHGGDTFVSDQTVNRSFSAGRDVFAIGNVVTAGGTARGDMHLVGFDVDQETTVGGDLLATGISVTLAAPIAGDATVVGFSVRNRRNASIGGNAVLIGSTITVDGPVSGSLTSFAQTVVLNARIEGDVWLMADSINFGPEAVITGQLIYSTSEPVAVPERVMSPDRISFEQAQPRQVRDRLSEGWESIEFPVLPAFMSMFAGFLVSFAFFIALAAIFQSFLPTQTNRMRTAIQARPGQVFLLGIVGLSILFGMVPTIALTVFGIPLVPIVLLGIVAVGILGYGLGAYSVSQWLLLSFGGKDVPSLLVRLAAFALFLVLVAVLNYIPFLGWVANYTLVLLGTGAMTGPVFNRILGNTGPAPEVNHAPAIDNQAP